MHTPRFQGVGEFLRSHRPSTAGKGTRAPTASEAPPTSHISTSHGLPTQRGDKAKQEAKAKHRRPPATSPQRPAGSRSQAASLPRQNPSSGAAESGKGPPMSDSDLALGLSGISTVRRSDGGDYRSLRRGSQRRSSEKCPKGERSLLPPIERPWGGFARSC